jgi:hypothetical protein
MSTMARVLAYAFDPALLASAADIKLDEWQAAFVRSDTSAFNSSIIDVKFSTELRALWT